MWPQQQPYRHLLDMVNHEQLTPLSHKAAAGFYSRTQRSSLRFDETFLLAMKKHLEAVDAVG
jgi:DNA (cytosine-5)-methyltransferase 1